MPAGIFRYAKNRKIDSSAENNKPIYGRFRRKISHGQDRWSRKNKYRIKLAKA
jgi:hypothetical protein